MDPDRFIQRCRLIISRPENEWFRIRKEKYSVSRLFLSFAFPLMIAGSFTRWAGNFFSSSGFSLAMYDFLLNFSFLFIFAGGIYIITPWFGGLKSFPAAFKLAVFSLTIVWILAIPGNISTFFIWMKLFSIYMLYVLFQGISPVMHVPGHLKVPCFITLLFILMLTLFATGWLYLQVR